MDGKLYENTIRNLFLERGFPVEQDPNIQGLTPDFLVSDLEKKCLIECTTLSFGQNCKKHDHLWGTNDPTQLNARLLSRASTKHTSGAEQKCTTREVIGQRKCPRQLFGRSVTEAGWQQAG